MESRAFAEVYKEVDTWFLMGSPTLLIAIFVIYLVVIYGAGPKFMENRAPWNLTLFTRAYNIAQVFFCTWIIKWSYEQGFSLSTLWTCFDDSTLNANGRMIEWKTFQWWFMLLRLAELTETVVFVLRKKQNQVSVLHVYHHITTASFVWLFTKYCDTFMAMFSIIFNSFIHQVMYTYYFLSSFKQLTGMLSPVKPLITIMQLIQFVIVSGICIAALLPSCGKSKLFYMQLAQAGILFAFFTHFFITSYSKKKKQK